MDKKVIALGCDHAGYDYKEFIKEFLQKSGYTVKDFGTHSKDSVDYPDFVHPVADAVESGSAQTGLLFCGSANGVAITANKHRDIRAAIAWRDDVAMLSRQHNDANVLCIPARFVSAEDARTFVQTFLDTPFEGGRHATRVRKICTPSA
ncbi:MAG: hypothetical protein RL213_1189 [Bacteroidota bacterium]